ncbi:MAG: methyltransferase domain-containing protein [Fidelibacterota bacterium]|nr:MAG: methyltransferase domain-containing protein [Candidatus Neomarinimicrobiota bacterium]
MRNFPAEADLPVYQDAGRYDAEHWWKVDDLAFWKAMAGEFGPQVLELAAGTGRLAIPVLQAGATYTGVEVSEPFLKLARDKLTAYDQQACLIRGDIRDFHLKKTFDLIFIGFNSFLHLLTDADAQATLACVREHCHSDTHLIIDIFVPDPLFLYRPKNKRVPAKNYPDPDSGAPVKVEETNRYDPDTELNHLRWYYSKEHEKDFLIIDFTLRMYFPDTMDRLLHDAGFRVLEKWGDYQRRPLDENSDLQIYVAVVGQ